MRKTALIVDDHPSFRASARRLLEADGDQVVGEAEDGVRAVAAVGDLRPDLVLLDRRLPDIDGFQAAKVVLGAPGSEPQILRSASPDSTDLAEAIDGTGARGFI